MFDSLSVVALQVGILFVLMGVGFACERLRLLNEAIVKGLVELLVLIITPCIIVQAFERPFEPHMMTSLGWAVAAAGVAHLLGIAFGFLCVRKGDDPSRTGVLRLAVLFSNAGFMGIPLEQALLGSDGVFFGAVYVAVFNLICWTYGLLIICGNLKDLNLLSLLFNPGIVGILFGLPLFFFSWRLPEVIDAPVRMLANLNTPVAMLVIGYYLSKASFASVVRYKPAYLALALRLLAVPLCLLGILYFFRSTLHATMAVAILIATSAPVGALTTMLAARYQRDVQLSVGLVSASTLLSILTMPPIIALALYLF